MARYGRPVAWRRLAAKIREAITCDALVFIACFSNRSLARRKSYQNEEFQLAIEQLKLHRPDDPWLIPVRFDNCEVPNLEIGMGRTLASIQRVDLFGPSHDSQAGRLVTAIQRLLKTPMNAAQSINRPAETPAFPGRQIMPLYFVCEESASMVGAPIDAINHSLPELHAEIGSSPVVADKTRFCLISFSDEAEVLLPLSDLSNVSAMPKLAPHGEARYGKAFDLLRETVDADVASLRASGYMVYRPTVFFLTGSPPVDIAEWPLAHRRVTDPAWENHPHILAFGFGYADLDTVRRIATVRAFAGDGISPAAVLREFAGSMIRSIVYSAENVNSTGIQLVMPDNIPGFTIIQSDVI